MTAVGVSVGAGVGVIPARVISPFFVGSLLIELISEAPITSMPIQLLAHELTSPETEIFPPDASRVVFSNLVPAYVPLLFMSIVPPFVFIDA